MSLFRFVLLAFLFFFSISCFSQRDLSGEPKPLKKIPFGYMTDKKVTAYHKTENGDLYVAHYVSYGGNCANYSSCYTYVLTKFDADKNVLWSHDFNDFGYPSTHPGFGSCFISGITTDDKGSIYIAGNYGCSEGCVFGTYFVQHNDLSGQLRSFFAKINPVNGSYEWSLNDQYGSAKANGATDIFNIGGKIYGCYYHHYGGRMNLYDGKESKYYDLKGNIGVVELSPNGEVLANYYGTGQGASNIFNPSPSSYKNHRLWVTNPKVEIKDNQVYLFANSTVNVQFGEHQLIRTTKMMSYYAKLNLTTGNWDELKELYSSDGNLPFVQSKIDDEDNIYAAVCINKNFSRYSTYDTRVKIGNSFHIIDNDNALLVKYNTQSFQVDWSVELKGDVTISDLEYSNKGLLVMGSFSDSLVFNDNFIKKAIGGKDPFILILTLEGDLVDFWNFGSIGADKSYGFINTKDEVSILAHSGGIFIMET